jgi:hypothetical protein
MKTIAAGAAVFCGLLATVNLTSAQTLPQPTEGNYVVNNFSGDR